MLPESKTAKRKIRKSGGLSHETFKFLVYVGISYFDEAERRECVKNARDAASGNGQTLGDGCAIVTKVVRMS